MGDIGKNFIVIGIVFMALGGIFLISDKIPGVGRLPGDVLIKKENFTFYFPLTTCLLLSLMLSILFMLWHRR